MNLNKKSLLQSYNPTSFKSRFSRRFLSALREIKNESTPARVKIAADKSMALAVGSRRAWSRAMLRKIRHRQHHKASTRRRRVVSSVRRINNHKRSLLREEKEKEKKKKKNNNKKRDDGGMCRANELRKLVPGGDAMDFCNLLDETAHYLKCLATQVQVMTSIDQFYST